MCYTDSHQRTPLKDPVFKLHGRQEDNISKTIKTPNHKDKGSDKPHSTPPPPQSHGTTNQSPWTSIEQEPQEETGGDEEGGHHEGMSPGRRTPGYKGEYRVHASIVVNKDISLTIAP